MSVYKALVAVALLMTASGSSLAAEPQSATFLGFRFIGNSGPMTPEEGARIGQIETSFISKLERAQKYSFVKVPDEMRKKIELGQPVGECAGCEIEFGKELGVPVVMWGTVQKVSNLILNLNIYMADVNESKMLFVKSVDMRGNSDLTWEQALNYMVKRYILKTPGPQKDK